MIFEFWSDWTDLCKPNKVTDLTNAFTMVFIFKFTVGISSWNQVSWWVFQWLEWLSRRNDLIWLPTIWQVWHDLHNFEFQLIKIMWNFVVKFINTQNQQPIDRSHLYITLSHLLPKDNGDTHSDRSGIQVWKQINIMARKNGKSIKFISNCFCNANHVYTYVCNTYHEVIVSNWCYLLIIVTCQCLKE